MNTAAVMTALGQITLQDRPMPQAGPGRAVVKVHAVGVCGSDTTYYRHGRIGDWVVDGEIVLGHEAAGEVVEVGAGVTGLAVGTRVAIEPGTPCRGCAQCMAGRYHLCPELEFLATPPFDGALVQYLELDARTLFPIPDTMTYEQAAMVEPLSVGIWACRRAPLRPGDDVLVTGAGPVGVLAAQAARALGARSVTISDVSDFRLQLAEGLGFTVERADQPGRGRFDVLLECAGAPGVLAAGMDRLREAGRAAMVGLPKQSVELPLSVLNRREVSLALVNRYQDTWPLGIALIASGRVVVDDLQTHSFPLADTATALETGSRDPRSMKSIIYPQQV
ncbi:alcohol dehydrogenase catalytic domain-containing protein [Auraticoccus sp. F435]|uniref:Alcohol dehydrogenase catalytic domain-containing protein n=1 Tax=Auraticoccus cholistanensis TaxID=2656650 RepID=A0A6A9UTY4_9ACTN|nr:NAD(P)-dependent alcohol dehydrogenase [Auraticoccus cholistanensis]MVA75044.1 alcohol dehydrogenase catalytic domain-containing protein [Auraticoccus cholistanensis]